MSKVSTYVCDVCGNEIKRRILYSEVKLTASFFNKHMSKWFDGDLCADCTKKLKRLLYGKEMKDDE